MSTKSNNTIRLENELKRLYQKRKDVYKEIDKVCKDLIPAREFKFSMTEHAILAYQEDIDFLPRYAVQWEVISTIESWLMAHPQTNPEILKGTAYKLRIKNVIYVINNYVVITVYPAD